jgi:hypothetical protein
LRELALPLEVAYCKCGLITIKRKGARNVRISDVLAETVVLADSTWKAKGS